MPASLVEISVQRGLPIFRCPVSGIPVWTEDGFEESRDHSPYIRFFVDWIGNVWVVSPKDLDGKSALEQRALIATLQVLEEGEHELGQDELMKQIADNLPSSSVVFEVLNPENPIGCGGGEICYVGFDFSNANAGSLLPVQLVSLDDDSCE